MEFKENDRIIWHSGFGYEIGYFCGEGVMLGTYQVDLCSGVVTGEVSHPKREIEPYTKERIAELTKQYGCEKSFSEIF